MSENNYAAMMIKSAVAVGDDINAIISPGIYIIPPANASSPDATGGVLTVHTGTPIRRTFTSDAVIALTSTRNGSAWTPWKGPLSRTNPFADIKTDGSAAILEALTNLGLDRLRQTPTGTTLFAADGNTFLFIDPDSWGLFNGKNNVALPLTSGGTGALNADGAIKNLGLDVLLAAKAPLVSPAMTGTPTAPTAALGNNTTQLATTAFVQAAISLLVNSSPAALDTLKELADALGNDANFATTVTNALAGKQPLDSTLTTLSGKSVAQLLSILTLGPIANAADIAAGTSYKLIDAYGLNSYFPSRRFGPSGYIRIPNQPGGLILQWGPLPVIPPGSSVVVSYGFAFPEAFLAVIPMAGSSPAAANAVLAAGGGDSKATFQVFNSLPGVTSETGAGIYIALGF